MRGMFCDTRYNALQEHEVPIFVEAYVLRSGRAVCQGPSAAVLSEVASTAAKSRNDAVVVGELASITVPWHKGKQKEHK